MNDDDWILLATFPSPMDANIARVYLENHRLSLLVRNQGLFVQRHQSIDAAHLLLEYYEQQYAVLTGHTRPQSTRKVSQSQPIVATSESGGVQMAPAEVRPATVSTFQMNVPKIPTEDNEEVVSGNEIASDARWMSYLAILFFPVLIPTVLALLRCWIRRFGLSAQGKADVKIAIRNCIICLFIWTAIVLAYAESRARDDNDNPRPYKRIRVLPIRKWIY